MTAGPAQAPPGSAFTAADFRDIYPPGIERHYWNHARNRIVLGLVRRFALGDSVLDVGCGTGLVTAFLRRHNVDCRGCDLGVSRPSEASVAPYLNLGVDACDLAPDLRRRVRTILLLDVLEHLERPRDMLARLRSAFPALRGIVFTVPARMDLWSNYDTRNRHYLRYDARTVHDLAEPNQFSLRRWSYFFHALYPPARLMRLLGIDRRTELRPPGIPALHTLLAAAFVAERHLLPRHLPGSSIWGVLHRVG